MTKKPFPQVELTLDKIVGGGQTLGTLEDGRKLFAWGGLPGETVRVQITKKKSNLAEGVVEEVLKASSDRVAPRDPGSYLSTSPWQIMSLQTENRYKAALIEEDFELHDVVLPHPIEVKTDGVDYEYRNKVEFSFWFDTETQQLSLAFFRRGTHGKLIVDGTSLAKLEINAKAHEILKVMNHFTIVGRHVKTLLLRSAQDGTVAWQLYIKEEGFFDVNDFMAKFPEGERGEIIFSNPKSPASVITKRLTPQTEPLSDTILGVPFRYATEGFFQINLPVYEQALNEMKTWIPAGKSVVDLYSGVGTIGLTIGGDNATLVEINEHAVREMERNIKTLGKKATPILAASEQALEYVTGDKTIIVDPPRAGLHDAVIEKLLEEKPERIIYLSCNPVTQARDVQRLGNVYGIKAHVGYNFFPHTPHIEHLVILDLKK